MPVLPPVASTMVIPARRSPRRSASSISATASRSLTLPAGLRISSLATMRAPRPRPMRESSTNGVAPTVAAALGCITQAGPRCASSDLDLPFQIEHATAFEFDALAGQPAYDLAAAR